MTGSQVLSVVMVVSHHFTIMDIEVVPADLFHASFGVGHEAG